jgi:hypothetical protein
LTSAHQNDLKIQKNINLKQKKINFFKNTFKIQKQTELSQFIKKNPYQASS